MDFLLIVIVPFIIAQKILLGEICNLLNMFRLINVGVYSNIWTPSVEYLLDPELLDFCFYFPLIDLSYGFCLTIIFSSSNDIAKNYLVQTDVVSLEWLNEDITWATWFVLLFCISIQLIT